MSLDSQFLLSPRLLLRDIRDDDINANYYRWLNDPEISQYLETRFQPQSLPQIAAFVAARRGSLDEQLLAICLRSDGRHIGNIKLGPINWLHRRAEISLFIGEQDCWGQGLASEAIALLCRHAFVTLNLNKLMAGAYEGNIGSIRAFEKCGFQREGLVRDYALVNNQGVALVKLGLTAKEAQLS